MNPPLAKLAVIGGRLEDNNEAVYAEMHRLAGGRILVFPTASAEPVEVAAEQVAAFRAHGFEAETAPLHAGGTTADDPGLAAQVAAFGSVYFTGGDQAQITAALAPSGRETAALAAIRASLAAGGLLAGSSAGAAMMSAPMLLGGTSLEALVHGVTDDPGKPGLLIGDGLGFFPFGMVDQHFIKRGRLGRLVVAMAAAGVRRGFGVDENTALLVEGTRGWVRGEYGVMLVDLGARSRAGALGPAFRLSYLDDGDAIDLARFEPEPGPAKRRVRKRERVYRAPAQSRRNAFGAYTLYDLMARLALGDPDAYSADAASAFDARTGVNVTVTLERARRRTRALIATPPSGLRMTGIDFRCSIAAERLSATRIRERIGRPARSFGMAPAPEARIVLLGSAPTTADPAMLAAVLPLLRGGPVGVLAAASAEPARVAREHVVLLQSLGLEAIDLEATIDTVEYAATDADFLETVGGLRALLFTGGNQTRLVETLLHRGEESALLRAVARAHAQGAALVAASGAASALSGVMIAGGSSPEALRFGVASDVGHRGLAIQEGVGLFGGGVVDQNLIGGERLGRLLVACAEESERFGVGVCEDSAAIWSEADARIEAAGRHGVVLVEVDPLGLVLHSDSFVAEGVRVTMLAPGDAAELRTGTVTRAGDPAAAEALLHAMLDTLAAQVGARDGDPRAHAGAWGPRGVTLRIRPEPGPAASIDLECPRDA
ncbi:cyanophycinase [Amaricoccus sp.]|uniref:cyanophycinase n=1 Tax=Amaricoccus sp. TaxID=1872485 RepID=UPI001B469B99|nr:cyanophycinase [Amaricoccus sp.]MBP7001539.1 cyanophycinase [Amaricoccus sp.]